jgi:O-methyltransferase
MAGATLEQRTAASAIRERYLDLLKGCLTRAVFESPSVTVIEATGRLGAVRALARKLDGSPIEFARVEPFDPQKRRQGLDWPRDAETMIGTLRLNNLHDCIKTVIADNVPGDFIETGVWRGGSCIFMRGALEAYDEPSRVVWLADSFEGLPKPNADAYPDDRADVHWTHAELAISLEQVQANFARYGLLDERVKFLKGWFKDTLPTAPIQRLALLRLDGDMYESTIQALDALYPKLSPGGFCIVDDYGAVPACKSAISDYRQTHDIGAPLHEIDWAGVYWRKA